MTLLSVFHFFSDDAEIFNFLDSTLKIFTSKIISKWRTVMANQRIILNCPSSERKECIALGGIWDDNIRKCYVPAGMDELLFEKWIPGNRKEGPHQSPSKSKYSPDKRYMQQLDDDKLDLTKDKFEVLRKDLLDLTRKNRLINTRLNARIVPLIRVVDELPDVLFNNLLNGKKFQFAPLPHLNEDPKDEKSKSFIDAFRHAQITNEKYNASMDAIDGNADDAGEQKRRLDRSLKDEVRVSLEMKPRPSKAEPKRLADHAEQNDINPSYDLPEPGDSRGDGKHEDREIQTLLLPGDLERLAQRVYSKGQSFLEETGVNVIQGAFGFIEWSESENSEDRLFSPLILLPVAFSKKKSKGGFKFSATSTGEEATLNRFIFEKLKRDFGVILPEFDAEEDGVEGYMDRVSKEVDLSKIRGKIRRFVCFGEFRASQIAIYVDLWPKSLIVTKIVDVLINGSDENRGVGRIASDYETDDPQVEKKVPRLILDSDASQFSTLVDIADGKDLAVEGPPGTGKSQTIVNAIANALHDGKKVLFVAAKKAAIEVVENRLASNGLGEFILPIHPNDSRREFVDSLRQRVEMDAIDSPIFDYKKKLDELHQSKKYIAEYLDFLTSSAGPSGLTVFDAFAERIQLGDKIQALPKNLKKSYSKFSRLAFDDEGALHLIGEFGKKSSKVKGSGSDWIGFNEIVIPLRIDEIIDECKDALRCLRELVGTINDLKKAGLLVDHNAHFSQQNGSEELGILKALDPIEETLGGLFEALVISSNALNLSGEGGNAKEIIFELGRIKNIFEAMPDSETLESLSLLQPILKALKVGSTNSDDLKAAIDEEGRKIHLARRAHAALSSFFRTHHTIPQKTSVEQIRLVISIVNGTPPKVLPKLGTFGIDIRNSGEMRSLARRRKDLKKEEEGLSRDFNLTFLPDSDTLRVHALKLAEPGWLLKIFFDREYRISRRFYLSIVKGENLRFNSKYSSERIGELIEYKRRYDDLSGRLPEGLSSDQDFDDFLVVISFFDRLENEVSDNNLKNAVRNDCSILDDLTSNLNILSDISFDGLFSDMKQWIYKLDEEQRKFQNAFECLKELDAKIKVEIDTTEISDLLVRIKNCKMALEKFNGELQSFYSDVDIMSLSTSQAYDFVAKCLEVRNQLLSSDEKRSFLRAFVKERQQSNPRIMIDKLAEENAAFDEVMGYLKKLGGAEEIFGFEPVSIEEADQLLSRLETQRDDLSDIVDLNELNEKVDKRKSIRDLIDAMKTAGIEEEDFHQTARLIAVNTVTRDLCENHQAILGKFKSTDLDKARKKFKQLDQEIIDLNKKILAASIQQDAEPPPGISSGRRSEFTDMGLIQHQVSLTRNYKSPRHIVSRARDALLELKPCWMMSPLAVAQYIDKQALCFDLVIIDEASQMEPAMAMGAIMRGRQVVVVGDQNQLPPTRFFRGENTDEDEDEDLTTGKESILQMANATFHPRRRLRWHYRSRDASLISYCNKHVYDESLVVFPNPALKEDSIGVSQIFVEDAVYKASINQKEADTMLQHIVGFMKDHPEKSLGAVVMNIKQKDLLEQMFDQAQTENEDVARYVEYWTEEDGGLEKFFIKNIENVQGDERDAIFIGTVYGPESAGGKVNKRFGPPIWQARQTAP